MTDITRETLRAELADAEARLARAATLPPDERADAIKEIQRQKRQIEREIESYLAE